MSLLRSLLYPRPRLSQQRLHASYAGRWVVVTGATSGIGYALTHELIDAGANLLLIARREDILKQLCQEAHQHGCEATYRVLDLRDRPSLEALSQELRSLSHLDTIFYCAGKSIHRTLLDAQDRLHDFDRTMDVNYRPLVALSLAVLPLFRASQQGRIVYASSVSTLYPPVPEWSAYHASKTAANVWCRTADAEWRRLGIRVQVAYLPLVHTPMSDATASYRKLPAYTASEAAQLLLRLNMSHSSSYRPWWAWITAPLARLFSPLIPHLYRPL